MLAELVGRAGDPSQHWRLGSSSNIGTRIAASLGQVFKQAVYNVLPLEWQGDSDGSLPGQRAPLMRSRVVRADRANRLPQQSPALHLATARTAETPSPLEHSSTAGRVRCTADGGVLWGSERLE